jgi:hypothetical protein
VAVRRANKLRVGVQRLKNAVGTVLESQYLAAAVGHKVLLGIHLSFSHRNGANAEINNLVGQRVLYR